MHKPIPWKENKEEKTTKYGQWGNSQVTVMRFKKACV